MLLSILLSLSTVTAIILAYLSYKFVVGEIKKRLDINRKHNPIFVKLHDVLRSKLEEKIANENVMSMSELEAFCESHPYFIADYDPDNETISDVEAFKPNQVEDKLENMLSQHGGIIMVKE